MTFPFKSCIDCEDQHKDNNIKCYCLCHHPSGLINIVDESIHYITLNKEECMTLYKLLEHQYIHYDNIEANQLVKRISDFAHQNELAR